jgi:hypothetical protein
MSHPLHYKYTRWLSSKSEAGFEHIDIQYLREILDYYRNIRDEIISYYMTLSEHDRNRVPIGTMLAHGTAVARIRDIKAVIDSLTIVTNPTPQLDTVVVEE